MRTKLALIADLSESLAECRYEMGRLSVINERAGAGLTLDQTSELLGHIRAGRTDDAVAVLRQVFRVSAGEALCAITGDPNAPP